MSKKKALIILFIFVFLLPIFKTHALNATAGFVSGNIWYSQDPFKEGDNIKIHTIVYNTDTRELSGTIFFFDGTLFLGNRSLSVPPKSSVDISIDWKVTSGDHAIFAQIQNAKFLLANGKYETASLAEIKSEESKRTVEKISIEDTTNIPNNSSKNNTNILDTVKNSTPAIVTKTFDTTTEVLENIRENINTNSSANKTKAKAELQKINNPNKIEIKDTKKVSDAKKEPVVEKTNTKQSIFLKPFIYVKLFFFGLFAFITGNKLIFYGLIILITISVLRFIWRLIF